MPDDRTRPTAAQDAILRVAQRGDLVQESASTGRIIRDNNGREYSKIAYGRCRAQGWLDFGPQQVHPPVTLTSIVLTDAGRAVVQGPAVARRAPRLTSK